jgi:hypothetical protein
MGKRKMASRTKIVMYLTKQEEELVTKLRNSETYKEYKKAYMDAREAVRLFRETDEYKAWIIRTERTETTEEEDAAFEIVYKNIAEAGDFLRETQDKFYDSDEYKEFMRPFNHPKIAEERYAPMSIIGIEEYDLILMVPVSNVSIVEMEDMEYKVIKEEANE